MKKLLLSVFAIAALASCMQDETLGAAQRENIVFENAFVDNATKAIDPSITTNGENAISEFQVWGTTQGDHDGAVIVPIFENEKVDNTTGDWRYDSGKTQYWIDGNKYNFAAVVNGTVETLEKGLPKTIKYSTPGKDLLYARSTNDIKGKASGNDKVGFTFSHLLSKAVFTFTNVSTNNTNNLYVVENITISGLSDEAVYTIGGAWDAHQYDPSYVVSFGNIVADGTATNEPAAAVSATPLKSNYECLLIPGKHNVTISCTIKLYLNGSYDPANPNENLAKVTEYSKTLDLTLAPRTAYNFALSAGLTDAIEFKVNKVNDWGAYKNL